MRIFITIDNKRDINSVHKGLITRDCGIIDIPAIIEEINTSFDFGDEYNESAYNFVVRQEIEGQLESYYKSKRFMDILYIVNDVDQGFVSNFKKYIESKHMYFSSYILIDLEQKLDSKIYKYFDDVR